MREIVRTSKLKARWQVSVGTGVVEMINQEVVPQGKQIQINGQEFIGPIIIARNVELREVSFVPVGADLQTEVIIQASSLKGNNAMTFEQWLQEKGINIETLDEANLFALQKMFEAEAKTSEEKPVEASTDEETKLEEDEEKKNGQLVQASGVRPFRSSNLGTASVGGANRVAAGSVIEASLLISGGLSGGEVEKLGYGQRIIDQAMSREHRGMGLQALLHSCIQAAGMYYPGGRADNGFIETAFEASNKLRRGGIRSRGRIAFDERLGFC